MILKSINSKNIESVQLRISDIPKLKINDVFSISLFIKNKSPYVFRNIQVKLENAYMLGILEDDIQIIKRIEANKEVEIVYHFLAVHGGRDFLKFKLRITELFDLREQIYQTIIFIPGEGLYRGDNHSHSTRSDGQNNNSVFNNVNRVRETRALSWLTPTDHMHLNTEDCEEINQKLTDFICLPNCGEYGQIGKNLIRGEYPNGKIGEHALQYNVNSVNSHLVDGRCWQDVIDEVNLQGGMFYLAHPLYPTIWWDKEEALNVKGITGLEVWQGDYHALDLPNRRAFILWDQLNSQGKKVNGIANSDGHFLHRIGHPFIMANLDFLNIDNIFEVLKTGRYYGSNGVHIRFSINGAENNQIAYFQKGRKACFKIHIYDESPLINIKIIKNHISKHYKPSIVVKEYQFNDEINSFSDQFFLKVKENEFYRVEVITREASIGPGAFLGDYYGVGFGYTNPVYLKEGNLTEEVTENNVSYTKSGYPYYVIDNKFIIKDR